MRACTHALENVFQKGREVGHLLVSHCFNSLFPTNHVGQCPTILWVTTAFFAQTTIKKRANPEADPCNIIVSAVKPRHLGRGYKAIDS